MRKVFISLKGALFQVDPENVKISIREDSEDAQFIRKFGFDPKDLPVEELFIGEVDYKLDPYLIEEFALALRGYAQALQGLVELYMGDLRTGTEDRQKLSQEYASWMDVQIQKLERDLEEVKEHLRQVGEGEVIKKEV